MPKIIDIEHGLTELLSGRNSPAYCHWVPSPSWFNVCLVSSW